MSVTIGEDHRPWGYYQILSHEKTHKIKRIIVYPGKRLSLQRHKRRSEHWHIVEGEALVTVENKKIALSGGGSVDIPKSALHRVENTGQSDLLFIEVQRGDYFGEDDIERIEDDFGRI
jgi:mannose-6-phosphate isomerase